MVSSWGGKLYYVILPFTSINKHKSEQVIRKYMLRTLSQLGIPTVDVYNELKVMRSDPMILSSIKDGHYDAKGYRIVADMIARKLKEDGFMLSKSDSN
ncbi:MAG: hypothetical protein ACQ9MH_09225 [Nitrospinales bacterium]